MSADNGTLTSRERASYSHAAWLRYFVRYYITRRYTPVKKTTGRILQKLAHDNDIKSIKGYILYSLHKFNLEKFKNLTCMDCTFPILNYIKILIHYVEAFKIYFSQLI